MTLQQTRRVTWYQRPIRLWTIGECLKFLNVTRQFHRTPSGNPLKRVGGYCLHRSSHWQLVDYCKEAHESYLRLMKSLHPDLVNGNGEKAKQINAVWTHCKELFARHGITT